MKQNQAILLALAAICAASTANAAVITDGTFEGGLDVDTENFHQNYAYLDVTDEQIKRHNNNGGSSAATLDGGWFTSTFVERWTHNSTGGVGGSGAMFSTNNGDRSFGQFSKDSSATTGSATFSIDLYLTAITDSVKVQLYGFNDNPGDQGVDTNRRPGMNFRNEYGMDTLGSTEILNIDVTGDDFDGTFSADTWQSYDLGASANDLGYTYYALYIGATEDGVGVDNFTMTVPEPGTYALFAGLLGLSYVMVRRRRA